MRKQKNKD